jgi:hypothetical protein
MFDVAGQQICHTVTFIMYLLIQIIHWLGNVSGPRPTKVTAWLQWK